MEFLFVSAYARADKFIETLSRTEWAIFRATNLEITLSYRQANILMSDLDYQQNVRGLPQR